MLNHGMRRAGAALIALGLTGPAALAAQVDPAEVLDTLVVETQRLDNLPADPNQPFEVDVVLDGEQHTLLLGLWNTRGDDVVAYTIGEDGQRTPHELPAPLTVRGGSLQDPTMVVAGSLLPDGLKVNVIQMGLETTTWAIQPMRDVDPGADRALHLVHRGDESTAAGLCGNDPNLGLHQHQHDHGAVMGRTLQECELAHDADFQFFQLNGSNVDNTIADIENVMATITIIYERDVEVTFENVAFLVRTTSGTNPYTTNNSSALLDQFRVEWLTNQGSISRDLAHLWTGRNLNGSVIGVAFLQGTCSTSLGFGLSESRFSPNFNARVALTAHEIGHNFAAPHCDGASPCNIMCSGLGGCNGVGSPNFSAVSINTISNFAQSRACLADVADNLVPPIADDFEDATVDAEIWLSNTGVLPTTVADNEPSGTQSLRFVGPREILSNTATFDAAATDPLYAGFWTQPLAVSPGEDLIFEYLDSDSGVFEELLRFETDETDFSENFFRYSVAPLPESANGPDAQFRFRVDGPTDIYTWYVDAMRIGDVPLHGLPFADSVDGVISSKAHWSSPQAVIGGKIILRPSLVMDSVPIQGDYWLGFSRPLFLSFEVEQQGTLGGSELVVELDDGQGGVTEVARIADGGEGAAGPETVQVSIPASAQDDGMALRFRVTGTFNLNGSYALDEFVLGDAVTTEPPACEFDLADTSGFGPPDGMVDFGDFFALSFLSGACGGGTTNPDCTGDFADSSGFGPPDSVIDFGDFFALSFQAGPCP